jgi:hypothetical protein
LRSSAENGLKSCYIENKERNVELKRFWRREQDPAEVKQLRRRLGELGITKTRGPDRGFAPDFPTPGPVTPSKSPPELRTDKFAEEHSETKDI